ncbi:MAG: type II toxin-antitoxin system VapC family toxin [Fimbriimonadaceae bacterium]|nr:type II toxin-antitoxin system VapC family toxin [Fimbriimonadaceae bacterium]
MILDTHVWIWSQVQPDRIRPATLKIMSRQLEVVICALSLYEAVTAIDKGKLGPGPRATDRTDAWLNAMPTTLLPLTAEVARLARTLPFEHADPFDRLIAATAFHENCPLVTADANLLGLSWLKTHPA